MGLVLTWVMDNSEVLLLSLAGAALLLFLLILILLIRLNRLVKAHKSLMSGMEGKNLEELFESYLAKVHNTEQKVEELNALCAKLEVHLRKSIQNVSLLRFNAFDNMGSDLSFAAALLDQNSDGFVISSINSREESRVYAKPISKGESTYHLSKEEMEAIRQALNPKNKK